MDCPVSLVPDEDSVLLEKGRGMCAGVREEEAA